ncbi:glycosyltransferase [Thermoplasma sp.]|uniref:glycosyltransferase n=1 Tax=Thermoplasma sp. TaxID=1973142 RepID=UPI0012753BB9|nr:glycosyltransferase [Thermoplasma sp.]KAA8922190.1 MAG: glycosyltransferase [Thermoplasma sp.]
MSVQVSVVAATLNEIDNIAQFIDEVERSLDGRNFEIIIVDDDSRDGTKEYIAGRMKQDVHLVVIENPYRYGMLRSLKQGIEKAVGEIVLVMDADLQHPPSAIPALISRIDNGCDIAIGSRYIDGGSAGDRDAFRAALSRGAEFLAHALVPSSRVTSDPMSGFFAFRRSLRHDFNYRQTFSTADYGAKILLIILAENRHAKVCDIGYVFQSRLRGRSKIVSGTSFLKRYLAELFEVMKLERRYRRMD